MKICDDVIQKVSAYEEKWGINYVKPGGKFYKFIMVLYVLALIFTTAINVFFALGVSMSETLLSAMRTPLYTVLIFIVAHIAAIVLTKFKNSIVATICSFVINAVACVGLVLTFAPLMEDVVGGYKVSFYWRHFAPLCILLVVNFIVNFIALRANIKIRKTYKKILDNAYTGCQIIAQDDSNE